MNSGQSAGREEELLVNPTSALLGQHYSGADTQLQCYGAKAAPVMSKTLLLFPLCVVFFQVAYEGTAYG